MDSPEYKTLCRVDIYVDLFGVSVLTNVTLIDIVQTELSRALE
jgi:hypothetical protein